MDWRDPFDLVVVVLLVNLIGSAPALFVETDTTWFVPPWFYPPSVLFGIAWSVLFTLQGVALYLVWRTGIERTPVRWAIVLFALQLGLNVLWTPAFFGLRSPSLGLVVIGLLLVAIVLLIRAFARIDRRAGILLLPYFGWTLYALALYLAIAAE